MQQNFKVQIQLRCPTCGQSSRVDAKHIPHGQCQVTCKKCRKVFSIDRNSSFNCKVNTPGSEPVQAPSVFEALPMKWYVDLPFCQGFGYDLPGLGALIRGGLVTQYTKIRPPGAKRFYQADEIYQLQPYLKQAKAEEVANAQREPASLDDTFNEIR